MDSNNQIVVILFGLLYFSFIIFTRKKGNFEEFSVAGRRLGFFLIFSSICASYIGPGWTMGLTRQGYTSGMFMAYIVPFCGVGLAIVGILLVPTIRNKFVNSYSIGDLVGGENGHNHKIIKIASGLVSLLFVSAITVAMSYAGGELINNVFGLSKFWSIVIMTSIVVVYSYFGGIRATIQTDAIQFVHFIILIPILALLLIFNQNFSWEEYSAISSVQTTNTINLEPTTAIIGMALLWLLSASGLDSNGVGRFLASRDSKVASNAAIAAGLFMAIWFILMVFIGSAGYYLYPELTGNDQVLLKIASNNFPGILYGIFIIAMIGVVMSSQDTLLNASSVLFSEDIVGGIFPSFQDKKLLMAKSYTVFLGIVSVIIASTLSSVLGAIMIVTEYYIPVMIPVIIFSILKRKCYWQSALAAMIVGFLSYLIWKNFDGEILPELLMALIFSTLAYLISDYIIVTRSKKQQQ
ncbi:MAG: sodium:solute symporter family protein [Cyclobacteriaceae bacterium]